jgi:hypothetical protein
MLHLLFWTLYSVSLIRGGVPPPWSPHSLRRSRWMSLKVAIARCRSLLIAAKYALFLVVSIGVETPRLQAKQALV